MVMGSPLAFRHRANAAPAVWIKFDCDCGYGTVTARDLFGTVRLVHHWGRIGTNGQELVEEFASEDETGQAEEGVSGSVNLRNALCEERLLSFRFFLRPAAQVASRRREQCR
jgi:hypothetical protein